MAKFRLADGSGEITLKHITEDKDRHGNVRVYFRKAGQPKVRLTEKPGTDAFLKEYRRAASGEAVASATVPKAKPSADTLSWLVSRYYDSGEFKRLSERTKHVRKLILGHICDDDGNKPYRLLQAKHVRRMRDLKADFPEAANSRVKALRAVYGWAVLDGVDLATDNPAAKVPYLEAQGDGHHSWTDTEIAQFEARHPIGTKARLAIALLINLAQRRSDIVQFGPKHVRNGMISFTQHKNRNVKDKAISLTIPIDPDLQDIIDATPCGTTTYLVTEFGKPFTANGFGNWFRARCDEAGLKHCSAHGLRKAASRQLAETGSTAHQIMAITGHTTLKEVDRYTKAVSQPLLAGQAMEQRRISRKTVPLFEPHYDGGTKASTKPLITIEEDKGLVPGTGIEPVTRGFSILGNPPYQLLEFIQ
ncbi:MAG: tyrosine-type recombinase/integrase [Devosia sp.]